MSSTCVEHDCEEYVQSKMVHSHKEYVMTETCRHLSSNKGLFISVYTCISQLTRFSI
jgi:hypothetical protein